MRALTAFQAETLAMQHEPGEREPVLASSDLIHLLAEMAREGWLQPVDEVINGVDSTLYPVTERGKRAYRAHLAFLRGAP